MQWILTAGRFATDPGALAGGVLLLETSEDLIPAQELGWILRSLGERGMLEAVDAVLVARPPASDLERRPDAAAEAHWRVNGSGPTTTDRDQVVRGPQPSWSVPPGTGAAGS